ncbi:enoyl-CoA hydratase/carnithine racemase [Streptomyces sp. KhCrAH-43]|uniref:crotonase/enoyl-CoA hydratase family protein n=1 Tax=unclassified Streptomyces TaxID=2593676 RepID=UPI00035F15FF|nr:MULTISPECIES: crotonase/enoyl-CoA hydratase family protein [unclassified Streptomyces]MYS32879.1 crotonase/enoyl-CoA hydratase family protein [Streptomyces sp. SID4920]MYX64641.1 crotonase/enoyl-CoA hydratase family protein [Streptomyces sp. SID8373]RAJ47922.1 enoyl-CoA hydratase/carnithine racemase [Streptomyces sp. KhCrAH-43]
MSDHKPGEVTLQVDGHIAIITVENEAKKNSYTPDMMRQLATHLTTFDEDESLWVAVFNSAGAHTTAGLDMPKFFGPGADAEVDPALVDPFALGRRTTKPVIAVVQGLTFTVGVELMLAADIAVAADTAVFQQLEVARGIAPLGGAHFRYLNRTGWGNAMYHLLRADRFDAERALQLGFVQEIVPFGQHLERAIELAQEICRNAPLGVRATKAAAMRYLDEGESAAIAAIDDVKSTVFKSQDCQEGIQSFIERRAANFLGR